MRKFKESIKQSVDKGLSEIVENMYDKTKDGFNPYFYGLSIYFDNLKYGGEDEALLQSLFLWIIYLFEQWKNGSKM